MQDLEEAKMDFQTGGGRSDSRSNFFVDDDIAVTRRARRVHAALAVDEPDEQLILDLLQDDPNVLDEEEHDLTCSSCSISPIVGECYSCHNPRLDLCYRCFQANQFPEHAFARVFPPENGFTILMKAIRRRMSVEFIEKLLAIRDIDLDVQSDRFQETALMLCLGMQSLYEHASDRKDKPRSYFQYAVEPDYELFELLLEHGADLNKQDRHGRTLLMKLISAKDEKALRLIDDFKDSIVFNLDLTDNITGATAMHEAIKMRNVDLVKWFFTLKSAKGTVDVDLFEESDDYGFFAERDDDEAEASLIDKSKNGSRKTLLADRTFVDTVDMDSNSPLFLAARRGDRDIVRFLIEKRADLDIQDTDGKTAVIVSKDLAMVEDLVHAGADLDMVDHNDFSCLMYAASNGDIDLVELFVENGADPSTRTFDNLTAVHLVPKDAAETSKYLRQVGRFCTMRSLKKWFAGLLYFVDTVSDLILLYHFFRNDDPAWFAISLAFIALSTVVNMFLVYRRKPNDWIGYVLSFFQLNYFYNIWRTERDRNRVDLLKRENYLWLSALASTCSKSLPFTVLYTYIVVAEVETAWSVYFSIAFSYCAATFTISQEYFRFFHPYYRRFFRPIYTPTLLIMFLWCLCDFAVRSIAFALFFTAFRGWGVLAVAAAIVVRGLYTTQFTRTWGAEINIFERCLYLVVSDAYWLQPSDWQRKPDFAVSWTLLHTFGLMESFFIIAYGFGLQQHFEAASQSALLQDRDEIRFTILAVSVAYAAKVALAFIFYRVICKQFRQPASQILFSRRANVQVLDTKSLVERDHLQFVDPPELNAQKYKDVHPFPIIQGAFVFVFTVGNLMVLYYFAIVDTEFEAEDLEWVWLGYLMIFLPYSIVATVWFMLRSKSDIVNIRVPRLSLLLALMYIVWATQTCFHRYIAEDFPCALTLVFGYLGVVLLGNIYLVRCVSLYLKFNITRQIIRVRLEEEEEAASKIRTKGKTNKKQTLKRMLSPKSAKKTEDLADPNYSIELENKALKRSSSSLVKRPWWWFMRRVLFKWQFTTLMFFMATAALMLTPFYFLWQFPDISDTVGNTCLVTWRGAATILGGYGIAYFVAFFVFSSALWGEEDAFYLKAELRWSALITMMCGIPWFILNLETFSEWNARTNLSTLFILFAIFFLFSIAITYPLFRTYVHPPAVVCETPEQLDKLDFVLRYNRKARKAFEAYMRQHLAPQHVFFWYDAEALLRDLNKYAHPAAMSKMEKRLEKVRFAYMELHDKYMNEEEDAASNATVGQFDVPEEESDLINISSRLMRKAHAKHRDVAQPEFMVIKNSAEAVERIRSVEKILKVIQDDVYKMLRGSYRGFQQQPEFKKLCIGVEADRALIDRHVHQSKLPALSAALAADPAAAAEASRASNGAGGLSDTTMSRTATRQLSPTGIELSRKTTLTFGGGGRTHRKNSKSAPLEGIGAIGGSAGSRQSTGLVFPKAFSSSTVTKSVTRPATKSPRKLSVGGKSVQEEESSSRGSRSAGGQSGGNSV